MANPFVITDRSTLFVHLLFIWFQWVLHDWGDAPMAEAYALKEGLMLAQPIGCNRLIIQSNCMEVVQTMKDGGFTANSATALYDECNIIWSRFQDIMIEHCNREANQAAHNLARRAMQCKQNCTWDDEPPSFILLSSK